MKQGSLYAENVWQVAWNAPGMQVAATANTALLSESDKWLQGNLHIITWYKYYKYDSKYTKCTSRLRYVHTHSYNRFTALLEFVRDHPGEQVPER